MPKTCPQCQSEAADAATFCPSCGASLAPAAGARAVPPPQPTGAPAGSGAPNARSTVPPFRLDAARWTMADRIAGIATIVLFISLFLSWFGITLLGVKLTASGLSAHGFLYIVMILCILTVAYLVLRAGWDELPINVTIPHLTTMLVATIINVVLVLIAFLDKPGGSGVGWEFGAFVGLIAALVAAAPYAIPQLRAKTM